MLHDEPRTLCLSSPGPVGGGRSGQYGAFEQRGLNGAHVPSRQGLQLPPGKLVISVGEHWEGGKGFELTWGTHHVAGRGFPGLTGTAGEPRRKEQGRKWRTLMGSHTCRACGRPLPPQHQQGTTEDCEGPGGARGCLSEKQLSK